MYPAAAAGRPLLALAAHLAAARPTAGGLAAFARKTDDFQRRRVSVGPLSKHGGKSGFYAFEHFFGSQNRENWSALTAKRQKSSEDQVEQSSAESNTDQRKMGEINKGREFAFDTTKNNHVAKTLNKQDTFYKLLAKYLGSREQDQKNAEDVLFDMFKNEETGLIPIGKFLAALRSTGIRKTDPRLKEVMTNLHQVHRQSGFEGGSPETQKLNRETFKQVISPNIVLITRAFKSQFVVPDFQDFIKDIEEMYWIAKTNSDGKVASYIPQLARMNPDYWGISVCTIDGQRFSIGDVNIPFTLQSCSKPLTYAMALETLGPEVVHKYIGTEPSGRNFNELVLDFNMKPHNPMINAGAILVCSLLKTLVKPEMTLAEKFDYVLDFFKRMAGNEPLSFNNATFLSEREAADRNYALGFYMREHKCYPEKTNLRECMDFYFQCCAMEANCDISSVIAATLANGGICPITDEKVLKAESVRNVLSLMHSCGMYDYSGQFAFKVGLPAKSGVSGAMLIVVPNVMGICVWSPSLDPLGNSCRGLQFCSELIERFNFHRYDNLRYATNKKNPRRFKFETTGLSIVNLLFSAASGDLSALRRHRLSGMDMTLSDYDGRTALHLAAAEGHLACVEFLLEHCSVPHDPHDRWGSVPLNEAEIFGHTSVVNYLKNWATTHPNASINSENKESGAEIIKKNSLESDEIKQKHFVRNSPAENPPFEVGAKSTNVTKDSSILDSSSDNKI